MLHQSFTSAGGGGSNDLKAGYLAIVLGDESQYNRTQFWVAEDRLRYGPSQEASQPLTGVTHMLFRIESRTERDDWMGLATIIQARDEALKAIATSDDGAADTAIKKTILLVRTSPDLTRADRKRVADALTSEFNEARGLEFAQVPPAAPERDGGISDARGLEFAPDQQPTLESVVTRRALIIDVDKALAQADDPLEELLRLGNQAQAHSVYDIPQEEKTKEQENEPDDADVAEDAVEALSLEAAAADSWRVARTLLTLRAQVNAKAPYRSKASDGTIGDARHQSRASDHNPWVRDGGMGVVTAMDITNDPAHGCDAQALAEAIRASRDQRVKYIIWNRRIANSSAIGGTAAWAWRAYSGTNPHDHHVHISVKSDKPSYDSTAEWEI
ncbi:MAG: hypothetical protein ACJ74J_11740 [Blastocatellia bacterium]